MTDYMNDDIEKLFTDLEVCDKNYAEYRKTWGSLTSFLTDYEHMKGLSKLTQAEIAQKAGTTQSAISRLECMKGKPTYELLRRLSNAVGGELFMTPLADATVTLPYDLHDIARNKAKEEGITVQELITEIIRSSLQPKENKSEFNEENLTYPMNLSFYHSSANSTYSDVIIPFPQTKEAVGL